MGRYLLVNNVIPSLGYNRLGLVTYAGASFPQAFLTDDMPSMRWVVKNVVTEGSAPGEGSQLADALQMACLLFDLDSPANHHRMVILFTDGGNDSEDEKLAAAIAELKKRDVQIVIAGLGSKTARPIPIAQLSPGDQYQFHDQQWFTQDGEVVTSSLDESFLIGLKNTVGGRYARIGEPSDFDMGSLTRNVDVKYIKGERELFVYPLLAGLVLLTLAVLAPREPFRQPINFNWRQFLARAKRRPPQTSGKRR
jgi:hypothetical protein